MQLYIGSKIVKAKPMDENVFLEDIKGINSIVKEEMKRFGIKNE